MKYLHFMILFLSLPTWVAAQSVSVTNVRAAQRSGTKYVDVYYDLSSSSGPATITVEISENGGATYAVFAPSLSGAVGTGIPNGKNKHVVWNAGADWNEKFSQAVKFRVTAHTPTSNIDDFVLVAAGNFERGDAHDGMVDAPIRIVYVNAFLISKYEITRNLWAEVQEWGLTHGYTDLPQAKGRAENHPEHSINWWNAVKWCNASSEKSGLTPCYQVAGSVFRTGIDGVVVTCNWNANGYRLPTEAEWEKAARGGLRQKRFPWGDTITHDNANYFSSISYNYDISVTRGSHPDYIAPTFPPQPFTSPVGSFPANGYGLYDMAGNVWELCWDRYVSSYYNWSSSLNNPKGPDTGERRVFRGGGSYPYATNCRVAHRDNNFPSYANGGLGFRPARNSVQ